MQKFIDAKHFGLKNRFDHLQKAEIVGVTFTEVPSALPQKCESHRFDQNAVRRCVAGRDDFERLSTLGRDLR